MNDISNAKKFYDLFKIVFRDGLKLSRKLLKEKIYIPRLFDYPLFDKDFEKSQMPNFKTNFSLNSDDNSFLDYSDIFNKYNENNENKIYIEKLTGFNNLKSFIIDNHRLKELFLINDSDLKYTFLYAFIKDFIGKYIFKYGTRYNDNHYIKILSPILNYLFTNKVNIDIAIPVLFLQFEKNKFKLNENMEIIKMSDSLQLSRASVKTFNYSSSNIVRGCAKYALIIKNYYLNYPTNNYITITDSLKNFNNDILFIIDCFFVSMFLEKNIYKGYGQIISIPKNWMFLIPDGNLINLYIKNVDNYQKVLEYQAAWLKNTETIDSNSLIRISKLFNIMINCHNKTIELALDRLCRALLRKNQEDAFLDILIGIEILLTDNEKTEVTYKLSIRVSFIINRLNKNTDINYQKVLKDLYDYRSAIVHGNTNKNKLSKSKTLNENCYDISLRMIQNILKTILLNKKLLNCKNIPKEIDNMIIKCFSQH